MRSPELDSTWRSATFDSNERCGDSAPAHPTNAAHASATAPRRNPRMTTPPRRRFDRPANTSALPAARHPISLLDNDLRLLDTSFTRSGAGVHHGSGNGQHADAVPKPFCFRGTR